MGITVGNNLYIANTAKPILDVQALNQVTEQIFNPDKQEQPNIDLSKLDLSKFNRVKLGTDLYSQRTNGEVALKAAKAATDFDVNFSKAFSANVQYLNSQAAQSLFTSKENSGRIYVGTETNNKVGEPQLVAESAQIAQTNETNKDKKGSNPFSFYYQAQQSDEQEGNDSLLSSINIFA